MRHIPVYSLCELTDTCIFFKSYLILVFCLLATKTFKGKISDV